MLLIKINNMSNDHNKSINPDELPQENFKRKEVFQHKQPADSGKPLNEKDTGYQKEESDNTIGKESQKTQKEEGLNEANSKADAGAFEGFEDQQ